MPTIDIPEEQILRWLEELSPRARREAIRRLLPAADYLHRAEERYRSRIEALARERGQEWGSLSDEQREELIDVILHE